MFNNTHKHTTKNKTKSNTGRIPVLYPSPEGATYPTQGASLCMASPCACASQSQCISVPVHPSPSACESLCMAHPSPWRIPVHSASLCHTPYKYLLKNPYFYAIMLTLFIPTFASTKKTHFTLFFHINQSFKKWKV